MDFEKVRKELLNKYPGKKIIPNDAVNPTEVLCEVDPSIKHTEYSLAIAIIDRSIPHVHKKSVETYKIIKGKLSLFIGNSKHVLNEGDEFIIQPGNIHWGVGDETWVECYSKPGWQFNDHILC